MIPTSIMNSPDLSSQSLSLPSHWEGRSFTFSPGAGEQHPGRPSASGLALGGQFFFPEKLGGKKTMDKNQKQETHGVFGWMVSGVVVVVVVAAAAAVVVVVFFFFRCFFLLDW